MASKTQILLGDCLELMGGMEDQSVDLVFTSPRIDEAARTYGIDFKLKGQDWVDWAVARFVECVRVCRGMVCWVVEGQTRKFCWSAAPVLFMADLHQIGVHLRKPPAFARVGIPGSGGPDWLRNDYEFVVCGSRGGKLPWSDNTAMGHPPKYALGSVGGGVMGSPLAHDNEAPFPEKLAEFFIRSFCPPSGIVLDCFTGSGTTIATALKCGRKAIGMDVRQSQVDLSRRRIAEVQPELVE